MRAMIVDDERKALHSMERLINQLGQVEIIGTYQDPRVAVRMAQQEHPDLIFLDIDMPELNGLEVAELIQNFSPKINIVFVTAYNEYAVKAFELNALDYILKPVQPERLAKTIQRLQENIRIPAPESQQTTAALTIRCFQTLEFEQQGSIPQIIPIRWRTTKAQELFAYLLHHRGNIIRKDILLEQFWPDTEWKKGFSHLYTTIYQIRKMFDSLGLPLSIASLEGGYQLDLQEVSLDVDTWEMGLKGIGSLNSSSLPQHLRLLELYRGDYFAEYDYLWAESERQRLKALWFKHSTQIVEYLISIKSYIEAVGICQRMQYIQPHVEESYFLLMQIYDCLGDRFAVEQQYTHLEEMLQREFEIKPSKHIQSWYHHWLKR